MINKNIAKAVIDSIENEYQLDIHSNDLLKNKFIIFRPYTHSVLSVSACILNRIKALFCLLLSFIFPLFSVFIRVKYKKQTQTNANGLAFICSEKAERLLMNENKEIDILTTLSEYSGERIKFPLDLYFTYLYVIMVFFSRYKRNIWFYPQLTLIPELVAIANFLIVKSPSKVLMCNHYDRWAYLFSFFAEQEYYELELTQHGMVTTAFQPSKKLKYVHKLTCFDNHQLDLFDKYIINKKGESIIQKPYINLTPITDTLSFLIVGHGNDNIVSLECDIVKRLSNTIALEDFIIFIKPHPAFDKVDSYITLKNEKVKLISDKNFFPQVNFVLHSGSTLAKEYQYSDSEVTIIDLTSIEQFNQLLQTLAK
jgi:hypothetical protein